MVNEFTLFVQRESALLDVCTQKLWEIKGQEKPPEVC